MATAKKFEKSATKKSTNSSKAAAKPNTTATAAAQAPAPAESGAGPAATVAAASSDNIADKPVPVAAPTPPAANPPKAIKAVPKFNIDGVTFHNTATGEPAEVDADTVIALKDYGKHIVVVTNSGQKYKGLK